MGVAISLSSLYFWCGWRDGIVVVTRFFVCASFLTERSISMLSIFFGRWPGLNPSACRLGTPPPYNIHLSPSMSLLLLVSSLLFLSIFSGTHGHTHTPKKREEKNQSENTQHIYNIPIHYASLSSSQLSPEGLHNPLLGPPLFFYIQHISAHIAGPFPPLVLLESPCHWEGALVEKRRDYYKNRREPRSDSLPMRVSV